MEQIGSKTFAAGELNADADNEHVFRIPLGFSVWSIVVVPIDGGANPAPTLDVQYPVAGAYYTTNPGGAQTMTKNAANVVSRGDAVPHVKVVVGNGATVVDGGVEIVVYGRRAQ